MHILLIAFDTTIDKAVGLISEKYIESSEDIIETCIWNNVVSVSSVLIKEPNIYDSYVVVTDDELVSKGICNHLANVVGIEENRIINFDTIYNVTIPFMRADRIMNVPNVEIEGVILGISHAEVGIIPELMSKTFVNLAVSSQDLYYNFKTFEYCVNTYPDKFRNLKYLIIDMYDYTYFNYDVSKTREFVPYISYGGYNIDEHNYRFNKNTNIQFVTLKTIIQGRLYEGITPEKLNIWNELFGNIHEKEGYKGYSTTDRLYYRNNVVSDEDVNSYRVETSIVVKRYEDTVNENIAIFDKIIERAKEINPDIEIITILLPRYSEAQNKAEYAYKTWKEEFYEIINRAINKYNIKFIDYKNHDIANIRECYQDVAHFNYMGAIAFTNILNKDIFGS